MRSYAYLGLLYLVCAGSAGCGDNGGANPGPDADLRPPDASTDPDGPDPDTARIMISEVVTAPQNDWNRSDGSGLPFTGIPGNGAITSDDEYIELYNAGERSVELTDWIIELYDSSPKEGRLREFALLFFQDGSSLDNFQPGHYLLIANPSGSMSDDIYIVLRNENGTVMDDVEVGGTTASRDREGDGPGDGAPNPDESGFSRGSFDEAVARPDGAPDTDDDQADFVKLNATPLGPNRAPDPPVEAVPPVVMSSPDGALSYPVTTPIEIEFSETIDASTVDGNLSITADGAEVRLGFTTFLARDRILVINPIGRLPNAANIQLVLSGGAGGVADLAGNALEANFVASFATEPAAANPGAIVLNEVCMSPQQDWDNSSGGDGLPFSEVPGSGSVSSTDEWVELLVLQSGPIDIRNYSLVVYNGPTFFQPTRLITEFNSPSTLLRVFGSGSVEGVVAGDRIIVGNPFGALLPNVYLELRDASGQVVDSFEVGGNSESNDRGGDGVMNGAPEPGDDGESTGLTDETVARSPDGVDTGDDIGDFAKGTASLGSTNPDSLLTN